MRNNHYKKQSCRIGQVANWFFVLAFSILSLCTSQIVLAQPVANGKAKNVEQIIDERYERVYVPEKDLAEYWSAVKPGVLLGKKEFNELLLQAQKAKSLQQGQPRGIVVEKIEYRAKINGDVLTIEAKCTLSKYEPGWATLVLPINNVSIVQAKLGNKTAPLGIAGKPAQLVLLDDFTGVKELTLTLITPVRRVGTDEIASFSLFPKSAAMLIIDVPKSRLLEVNGSVLETEVEHRKKRQVKTSVGGNSNIQIRLRDAVGESLNESLVFAQTMYAIGVERDSVNWQAECQIDLFGKRFNRLEFSVPSGLEIADVQAPGLQNWDLEDNAQLKNQTKITLTFRETIPQQIRVTLLGVQLLEKSDDWAIAPLKLHGVTSNTGGLAVSVSPRMRLKPLQMEGVRPSVRYWKPTAKFIQPGNLHFYDLWNEDFTFRLSNSQTAREVQAAVTNILDVDETEISLTSSITLQTLFSPLYELNLEMPAEWSPKQIRQQQGEIDWQYISKQAGVHRLRLPLKPPLKPGEKRTIQIGLRLNREKSSQPNAKETIVLPELKMEGVNILEGSFVVRANPRLDVIPHDTKGMDPAYLGMTGERFGYRYQNSHIAGQFDVVRKPMRFNVTTMQIVSLDEETISLRYQVMLDIAGGGLREVTAHLSSTGSIKEEFRSVGAMRISDQQRTKTEAGTTWEIKFDRFVTGKVPLLLSVILPREKQKEFTVPELVFDSAQLQEQYFAFSVRTDQRLNVTVKNKAGAILEPIDPADFPAENNAGYIPHRSRIVAVYHAIKPGVTAVVSESRFDAQAIPTAIGHELRLTSLLLESGQFQQQAKLTFAAVGVQSMMVNLPENATLWSTSIDNIPVTARKVKGGFVVSLSGNQSPHTHRTIEVLYGFDNESEELGAFSTPLLPSPEFAVLSGTGNRQPLRILKTEWEIHHAADSQIEPLEPGVEQMKETETPSWLARLVEKILQTSWQTALMNLFVGFVVLIIPAGLIKLFKSRGWALYPTETKKGPSWLPVLLVFGGIATVLVFALLASVQSAREAAPRLTERIHGLAVSEGESIIVEPHAGHIHGETSAMPAADEMDSFSIDSEKMERAAGKELSKKKNVADNPFALPKSSGKKKGMNLEARDGGIFKPTITQSEGKSRGSGLGGSEVPKGWGSAELNLDDGHEKEAAPFTENARGDKKKEDEFVGTLLSVNDSSLPESQIGTALSASEWKALTKKKEAADGLLSLQLTMQIPDDLRVTRLRSFGERASVGGLRLRYLSQTAVNRLRWLIIAGVLLIFWLLRHAKMVSRCSWLVLVFGLPMVAMGIVPDLFLPLLEGVLLGGLIGTLIWIGLSLLYFCLYLVHLVCRLLGRITKIEPTVAGLLILVAIQTNGADLFAKDPIVKPQIQQQIQSIKPQRNQSLQQREIVAPVLKPAPRWLSAPTIVPPINKKLPLVFPYADAKKPLAAESVFVPESEYLELWKIAHPEESITPAPVAYLVNEASYVAEVVKPDGASKQHTVSVKARFVIRNFRGEQQTVPLPLGAVMMESVEVNGQKATATLVGKNQPAVLIPAEKLSLVDVQFRLPANAVNGAGQFTISFQPVAAGSFSFLLPSKETQVRINEGKTPYQLVTKQDKSYAEVVVTAGGQFSFSWQPKVSTTQMQFLSCESAREVLIRDTGAELRYAFRFDIAQGTFSEIELQLPENVKLKSLAGDDLAGWQMQEKGRLRILLKLAVDDRTLLTISLFSPLKIDANKQEYRLPDVVPQGVTREIGSWAIQWENAISARFTTATGVRQIKNNQFKRLLKTTLTTSPQRVYRFSSRPMDLRLEITRKRAMLAVQQYTLADIQQHKTHVATFAKINIDGEPRLSVDFDLPKSLQIVDLTATDLSDWFITPGENNRSTLTVLFASPRMGNVEVVARGHVQQEVGVQGQVSLTGLQLKDATRTTSFLGIGAAEILAVSLEAMDGWKMVDPKSLPTELRQMANFSIRLGMNNRTNNPRPVTVSLSRQTAQMKAHSVSLIAVSDASVDYGLSMQWIISKAAADRFSFIGPKWMEKRIEFQSPGIRLVTTRKVDEHRVEWTIETQRPQNKQFFLTAAITVPYPEDRTVSTPKIMFVSSGLNAEEQAKRLEIQGHYAILVNLGKEPLDPISDHARLLVQEKELPIKIPGPLLQQAMEIIRVTDKVVPSWELKKRGQQQSPPATITLAQLKTVIDESGSWRTLAKYRVKNRRRQFLPVLLPKDAELLSVIVADRPSKSLRKQIENREINLIPLPPASDVDLAIEVRIVLQGKLNAPLLARWGLKKVSLPSPSILSPEDSKEFGIPVMYTTWELSTPDDIAIRPSDQSNMNLSSRQEATEVSLKSKLRELSELSRILSSSKNSYGRRSKAAYNLRKLQSKLGEIPVDTYSDSNGDDSFSLQIKQQQQVIEEATENINKFEKEAPQSENEATTQSRGRGFIELNNGAIFKGNTAFRIQSGGEQQQGVTRGIQIAPQQQAPAARINAPQIKSGRPEKRPAESSKLRRKGKAAPQKRSLDRKSLLDENRRQNSYFYNGSSNQKPKIKSRIGLHFHDGNTFELFKGNHNQNGDVNGNGKLDIQTDKDSDGVSKRQAYPNGAGGGHFGNTISGNGSDGIYIASDINSNFAIIQGGNEFNDPAALLSQATSNEPISDGKWTAAGGLSLPIELPSFEQSIVFSKVEGKPELVVEVYSRDLISKVLGIAWAVVSAVILLWLLGSMKKFAAGNNLPRLYTLLILIGLASFTLLPVPLAWFGLIIAVIAGILYALASTSKLVQQ